jgi:hypothetical protein
VQREFRVYLLAGFIVSVIVFMLLANTILGTIGDWQVLRPAEKNYVICEMPEGMFKDLSQFKTSTPLEQIGSYIIHYPLHFINLASKRALAFFTLVRPYYSHFHNWALVGLCIVLYGPLLLRKMYLKWEKNKIFACLIICSFLFAVCFQCDDYHSRFHHAIIPIFLFIGLFASLDSLTTENKNQLKALFSKI